MITSDSLMGCTVSGSRPVGTVMGNSMRLPAFPASGRLLMFTTTTRYFLPPRSLTDTVCPFTLRVLLSVASFRYVLSNGNCRSNCSATTSSVFSMLIGIITSLPCPPVRLPTFRVFWAIAVTYASKSSIMVIYFLVFIY